LIVVIDEKPVGLEVVEYLAHKNNSITIVEMINEVAKDLRQLRKICVMESLYMSGVKLITSAKCVEIKENVVVIEKDNKLEEIPCDSVVIAVGASSRNSDALSAYCKENNIPYHIISDAVHTRRAINTTAEAAKVARAIYD